MNDVSECLSDVACDVIEDTFDVRRANTVVNALGKKLKAIEMLPRYGARQ